MLLIAVAGCAARPAPAPVTTSPTEPFRGFLAEDGGLDGTGVSTPVNYVANPAGLTANELVIAVNPKDPLNLIAGGKD